MSTRRGPPRGPRLPRRCALGLLLVVAGGAAVACNSLLGLTDFEVTPDPVEAGKSETSVPDLDATTGCVDGQTSDVDLKVECYPCNPLTNEQLLNACSGAQCISFDNKRITSLLPDGGLPALPPPLDGGT